ncbi:DUF1206 domain-containing protein [Maribius pontilimi]|uniref:DUF1206 domain-containing protein n=1 Tax=Palleronia pontilimi TaxID=1964209 RepID=A0A934MGZ9_9RHOB|nr:DUF1206 domain-containing protein [Palleronia pontilimi]MBJ3762874.1 DUF1206 domain-containing protein [Palleronia pontilimi]
MAKDDFDWAIPFMRAGYAGRALVYLVVTGFSLWAVSRGGQAEGTMSAFATLERSTGGTFVLLAIFAGMASYAIWRLIDAAYDLEDYGSDGEGRIARLGMVVTGLLHLGIGIGALILVFSAGGDGSGSTIGKAADAVMAWPGGRIAVALAGVVTVGAGLYYMRKAWKRAYRAHLIGNHFTRNWDPALRGGVASQGFVVTVIGALLCYAALTTSGSEAGGVGKAFDWLGGQPYGRVLVGLLCVGLLGFALFCAVNAAYRIVPKASHGSLDTLAARIKQKAG